MKQKIWVAIIRKKNGHGSIPLKPLVVSLGFLKKTALWCKKIYVI